MNVKESVLAALAEVYAEKDLPVRAIRDDDRLGNEGLGLDSLDMATLVALLDTRLSLDPFAHGAVPFRTVGDLLRLYERANDHDR